MKKLIAVAAAGALAFTLAGCSSAPKDDANAVPKADTQVESDKGAEPVSEYSFKDGVINTEDVTMTITETRVIPVGEVGNEYGKQPVIAFWYDVTNKTNKEITPMTAWIACVTAYQDTNPNQVNKLDVGSLPDQAFLSTQMENIKEGGTAQCAIAYYLDDEVTPVILKATKGLRGDEIGEQEFAIA
ncbi:DUF5067 domain-containing protein [Gordonibacter sp.]|uniref:DUF5067 domain-containing protein n=1 Tax=Gordonibacter sp. TaxID=1968902 RepID=UPI002FC8B390